MARRTEHNHEELVGAALVDGAKAALERAGEQWTDLRAATFEVIAAAELPLSAYGVTDTLSERLGRRVPANSVYRILELFTNADIVRRIESANAFVASAHPGCQHDCMYLICDGCGKATHLDNDQLARKVRSTATTQGFVPDRPMIEVHGHCAGCAR